MVSWIYSGTGIRTGVTTTDQNGPTPGKLREDRQKCAWAPSYHHTQCTSAQDETRLQLRLSKCCKVTLTGGGRQQGNLRTEWGPDPKFPNLKNCENPDPVNFEIWKMFGPATKMFFNFSHRRFFFNFRVFPMIWKIDSVHELHLWRTFGGPRAVLEGLARFWEVIVTPVRIPVPE